MSVRLKQRTVWEAVRQMALYRDGYRCVYCPAAATEVDHRIPLARGGSNDPSNLQAVCARHNRRKATLLPGEFKRRAHLASKHGVAVSECGGIFYTAHVPPEGN